MRGLGFRQIWEIFHPKKMAYLNSLADENLAQLIHHALNEINPHIAITQEIGTFMDTDTLVPIMNLSESMIQLR